MTVQEAAQTLGRSTEQVRRYLREGKLEGQRIGGQWFIKEPATLHGAKPVKGAGMATETISHFPGLGREAVVDDGRLGLFERINRRREQIRVQWTQLGVNLTAGEIVRASREEES
jgi:excisionase family DNA binding protein